MSNRIVVFVFLLAAFTMPTFAQQSNPSSSDQSAVMRSGEERERLTAPKATNFWDGDDPNFLNLITHPFANKKYVQRYTAPIRERVNELDEIRTESSTKIKDIDGSTQNGLQLVSAKVNVADQHATDAGSKAQGAQTTATEASNHVSRVEQMVANLDQYKGPAPTEIRFSPGQSTLSKDAKDALDQLATPLKGQKNYIIEVRGFSPGRGSTAITRSQKMADSVVRYLVLSHQIPVYRIHTINMGNASAGSDAKPIKAGRLEVSVLKNDVVSTAQR